ALREKLARDFHLWATTITHRHVSADSTEKLLLQMHDGHRIECVLLKEQGRRAICISTQVGCAMGCVFCASGLEGVVRNLTTGEILEQILRLDRLLPAEERLSHIVVMGMGEPLANLDRLLPALAWASSPDGLGIGGRKITISTVGLTKALDRLADMDLPYHLAVSLHAPNDELRRELVPVSKNIGIDAVLASADRYFSVTGRRVTYEYVLLAGVNDQPQHARELADLLGHRNAFVNLIPFNAVEGLPFKDPSEHAVKRFLQILESEGVQVHVRKRKGDRINAACGQLRRSKLQAAEPAVVPLTLGGAG
ncbi:MAG TPA: 23S rRNA (adenine(2503)-C(2))-methyltransferase RlmN, partial [Pirellulales bacterium]